MLNKVQDGRVQDMTSWPEDVSIMSMLLFSLTMISQDAFKIYPRTILLNRTCGVLTPTPALFPFLHMLRSNNAMNLEAFEFSNTNIPPHICFNLS